MTLAGLVERSEHATKTLRVRGTELDDAALDRVLAHVGAHDVNVVYEDGAEDSDSATLTLEDESGVVARDTLAAVDGYVTGWQAGAFGVERDLPDLLRRLDDTYFRSYGKDRMIVASRLVEEGAWSAGDGTVYAGFQRLSRLRPQEATYRKLVRSLDVHVFGSPDWDVSIDADGDDGGSLAVHESDSDEVDDHWWVVYDGDGDDDLKAALVAQERAPDEFYGFWTFDPTVVDDAVAHLESTYVR